MGFPVPGTGSSVTGSSLFPEIAGKQVYVPSTNVAATDTAAIQAAHDSFGANGGMIAVDQGPYAITPNVINFTNPVYMRGTGPYLNADHASLTGSRMTCNSATGTMFQVNADNCTFERLSLMNTSGAASAGYGINVPTKGYFLTVRDCAIVDFWNCLATVQMAVGMRIESNYMRANSVGFTMQNSVDSDQGDHGIANNIFYCNASATAGVYWTGGGGPRLVNNKFNGSSYAYGIVVSPATGAATTCFLIVGNSIENANKGVGVLSASTGVMHAITIAGNEINCVTHALELSATSGTMGVISVTGNVVSYGSGTTVVENVDKVTLAANIGLALSINPNGRGNPTNLRIDAADFSFTTVARPAASIMAAGSNYYDTTLHLVGTADGAGNYRKPDGTIF